MITGQFELQINVGDDVFLCKSLLEQYYSQGINEIRISYKIKECCKVSKGDVIGVLFYYKKVENKDSYSGYSYEKIYLDSLYAHKDGYAYGFLKIKGSDNPPISDSGQRVCTINSIENLVNDEFDWQCKVSSKIDSLTSKTIIESAKYSLSFVPHYHCYISLKYLEERKILCLHYIQKELTLLKNDTVSFLLKDGAILEFKIASDPIKDVSETNGRLCELLMSCDDIGKLISSPIKSIRIQAQRVGLIVGERYYACQPEIKDQVLKQLFVNYKQMLESEGLFNDIVVEDSITEENKETCFVYIMKDEKNGCHKIGISNRPEYREKTLQSDKPFIVMLQAREFPSRKMARAFESALHSTYADKNIRGEWFDLTPEEVEEVIKSLK